ncbi:MAG: biuret amidohydrolase [Acidimicrobiaceae bacterium]
MPVPAELKLATTALIVTDVQRYFVEPEMSFGRLLGMMDPRGAAQYFERVHNVVVPAIARVVQAVRGAGGTVIFSAFGSATADGRDLPSWARRHNELARAAVGRPAYPSLEDPACDFHAAVRPVRGERSVMKSTSGILTSCALDKDLRAAGVAHVVVAGLTTDVCVAQIARELSDRDLDVVVIEDGCATVGSEVHEVTLQSLERSFAFVARSEDLLGR